MQTKLLSRLEEIQRDIASYLKGLPIQGPKRTLSEMHQCRREILQQIFNGK